MEASTRRKFLTSTAAVASTMLIRPSLFKTPPARATALATVTSARAFVRNAVLPDLGFKTLSERPDVESPFEPDLTKDQAATIGAGLFSFQKGVTNARRNAITHSALLAHLVAKESAKDPTKVGAYYETYFDALVNCGWAQQLRQFRQVTATGSDVDVHEALIKVAQELMGAGTTAFALVAKVLTAMKSADAKTPWITVFNRESTTGSAARFQVGLVHSGESDDFLVSLMAFELLATKNITQVLFFKFIKEKATLSDWQGAVTIAPDVILDPDFTADIVKKLIKHARDFVKDSNIPQA